MSQLLIGIDVGASKTTVLLVGADGVRKQSEAPGAALRPGMILRSANTVAEAVRAVLRGTGRLSADVLVVGAAGAGRKEEHAEFSRALRAEELAGTVRVTTDGEIALRAAFDREPGILIAAGTGSIGIARIPAGEILTAGGYGWQMGDEGSGYAMGRAALGSVGRAHDDRGPATRLTHAVLEATRSESLPRLVRWAAAAGPGEVAALARHVIETATEEDPVAMEIVAGAADALVSLAVSLAARFPAGIAASVALTGGLLRDGSPLQDMMHERLVNHPNLVWTNRPFAPAEGAIMLAQELAEGSAP
jgi:N-acetylglucosamine kinase-like BadF-type ATPase